MSAPDQQLPQLQLALRSEKSVRASSARTADTLILADGTRLQLGPIGADHRDGLAALFCRLSPKSRRLRYLGSKRELTPQELASLTDIDHVGDEAIVAVDERDGSIVGVARYAQSADRAGVADVAIEVADDVQCLGIGTALAGAIVERACANGLTLLTATTLWENRAARALMRGLGFRTRASHGSEIELELELSPDGEPAIAERRICPKETTRSDDMSAREQTVAIDGDKLNQFVFRAVEEVGATLNAALVVMGDKLGLYTALAGAGGLSPAQLAARTGTAERYVREWLNTQAAGGYIEFDPERGRYSLAPEQAVAFTDPHSPAYLPGFFQLAVGSVLDSPRIVEAARTGDGLGWHEHVHEVHDGCERFFRPGYNAHLVSEWLPALEGVVETLERGGRVADVGCGHGASTILMAQAFPNSTFLGSDYHDGSIETARRRAQEAGVADRVRFQVAAAAAYGGSDFDLVTMFDCLHDMGDPVAAARHVHATLNADGTWMIVEPYAGDRVEDNLNPVGRAYYGFSTLLCTPASLSQEVGMALGAQAGEARIGDVVLAGGFTRFRRVSETPFNLVLEARP